MLVVAAALILFLPWMIQTMTDYTRNLFVNLPLYLR
jgi:flagellar biosynthesis protein FliQ